MSSIIKYSALKREVIERLAMLGQPSVGYAVCVSLAGAIDDGDLTTTLQKPTDLLLNFKSFTVFLANGLLSQVALHFPSSPSEPGITLGNWYCSPETAR